MTKQQQPGDSDAAQPGGDPTEPVEPGDPRPEPDQPQPEPVPPEPSPTVQPVPGEPSGPIPLPTEPTEPLPVNPTMGSFASGPQPPVPPGPYAGPYPGHSYQGPQAPGQAFPGQGQPTQPIPTQPYPPQQPGVEPYGPGPYGGEQYPGQPPGPYPGQQAYPGQPYPEQPYAQQPYGAQPYPVHAYPGQPQPDQGFAGQPYPDQPYAGQPPYGGPPQGGRSRVPLFILLGVGVLVIGLVLAFTVFQPRTPVAVPTVAVTSGATATASAPPTSVPPPQPADAAAAVQGYLGAIAAGDAAAAMSYAATQPDDTSMLNNAVLATALRRAPLTDVQVSKGTGSSSFETIDASYRLGDRVVNASFPVSKVGSDWRLDQVAVSVNLSALHPDRMALRVNGASLTGDTATLFPGAYAIVPVDTRYAVTSGSFVVQSPTDRPDTYSLQLRLSTQGRSLVRAAAQKKLNACVKKKSLKPAGCGYSNKLPGGNKPRNSTIRWTITKGKTAMKKIKPTVALDNPSVVRAPANVQLKLTLRSTNGRSWYGYNGIYMVQAQLTDNQVNVRFG